MPRRNYVFITPALELYHYSRLLHLLQFVFVLVSSFSGFHSTLAVEMGEDRLGK